MTGLLHQREARPGRGATPSSALGQPLSVWNTVDPIPEDWVNDSPNPSFRHATPQMLSLFGFGVDRNTGAVAPLPTQTPEQLSSWREYDRAISTAMLTNPTPGPAPMLLHSVQQRRLEKLEVEVVRDFAKSHFYR